MVGCIVDFTDKLLMLLNFQIARVRIHPLAAASRQSARQIFDGTIRLALNVLHEVSESVAAFRSLADAWADATTPHGSLMVTVRGRSCCTAESMHLGCTGATFDSPWC